MRLEVGAKPRPLHSPGTRNGRADWNRIPGRFDAALAEDRGAPKKAVTDADIAAVISSPSRAKR